MASNRETLKIRITLEPEFWGRAPEYQVEVDGEPVALTLPELTTGQPVVLDFEHEFIDGDHTIGVRLLNKNAELDTVMEDDRVVKDMLLTIREIIIEIGRAHV